MIFLLELIYRIKKRAVWNSVTEEKRESQSEIQSQKKRKWHQTHFSEEKRAASNSFLRRKEDNIKLISQKRKECGIKSVFQKKRRQHQIHFSEEKKTMSNSFLRRKEGGIKLISQEKKARCQTYFSEEKKMTSNSFFRREKKTASNLFLRRKEDDIKLISQKRKEWQHQTHFSGERSWVHRHQSGWGSIWALAEMAAWCAEFISSEHDQNVVLGRYRQRDR